MHQSVAPARGVGFTGAKRSNDRTLALFERHHIRPQPTTKNNPNGIHAAIPASTRPDLPNANNVFRVKNITKNSINAQLTPATTPRRL
jgi:hypothetical protein